MVIDAEIYTDIQLVEQLFTCVLVCD